jgi:hypothetical protein
MKQRIFVYRFVSSSDFFLSDGRQKCEATRHHKKGEREQQGFEFYKFRMNF